MPEEMINEEYNKTMDIVINADPADDTICEGCS